MFEVCAEENTEWDLYWSENINQYMDHTTNAAWLSWLASASREGYKLVPIEVTQEMIDKFPEVFYQDTYAGECSMWVDDETIRLGYKAMIGVVE